MTLHRRFRQIVGSIVVALLLLQLWPQVAAAATITVTTTADELDVVPDATCSLREAVRSANLNLAVGGCTAGSGADTIVVPAGVYTLTIGAGEEDAAAQGDLDLTGTLTITGAGASTTIVQAGLTPGSGIDRVFDVRPGATATITGLTVRHGSEFQGGGINVEGTLSMSESVVTTNDVTGQGGGFFVSGGTLTLTNSTVSNNTADSDSGGFSLSSSTVTISGSTISGNTAPNAGGIFNLGTLTLTNSTLSGNTATNQGGALLNFDTATLTHVTLAGNAANSGGGIFMVGGSVTLRASALDTGASGANCSGAGVATTGSNVADDATCFPGGVGGDQVVASVGLGALANNGGSTQTHAPQDGSAVLDAVIGGCPPPATDQRGLTRAGGLRCEAGSVERQGGTLQFSSSAYTTGEAVGATAITVTRTGGSEGTVGVTAAASDGSALAPADFTAVSTVVSLGPGVTSAVFNVTIVNDTLTEPNETVNLALSGPTGGAALGSPAAAILTIIDDDAVATPTPTPTGTPGPSPTVTVTPTQTATPTPTPLVFTTSKSDDDDEDDDEGETEQEHEQRLRTNKGNLADYHTEGNVIETALDASPPYVVIVNVDGPQRVNLYCGSQCPTVRVGDYLMAEGEKEHEGLFHASEASVKRTR